VSPQSPPGNSVKNPAILLETFSQGAEYLANVFLSVRDIQVPAAGTSATGHRYITDKNGEEQYLSNLLLEKGLAVRVRE